METEEIELDTNQAIQTQHAMLVIWGLFAQQIGLVDKIEQVKLSQKSREHTPQKKVLEFLVAMLAGCKHLKDISRSAHPLDQDEAVAEAWGQEKWADYSGVSRTLASLSQNETDALIQAFNEIEQTYLGQETASAVSNQGYLVYDADLTGLPVSSTSKTYPKTAFGYMGDTIQLGYQAAVVSLHSPTYGRLWISNRLHPGDTVSVTEAKALVESAEARLQISPLRRPELVEERIEQTEAELSKLQEKAAESEERVFTAEAVARDVQLQFQEAKFLFNTYEREYRAETRQPTAYCKFTRAKRKVTTYQERLPRCQKQLDVAQRRFERHQRKYQECLLSLNQLRLHHQRLLTDNEGNPHPVRIIIRIDAGFASQENIDWLIEMGYEVFTKDRGTKAKDILQQELSDTTEWHAVGRNATMTTSRRLRSKAPSPIRLMLPYYVFRLGRRHVSPSYFTLALMMLFLSLSAGFIATMSAKQLRLASRRANPFSRCIISRSVQNRLFSFKSIWLALLPTLFALPLNGLLSSRLNPSLLTLLLSKRWFRFVHTLLLGFGARRMLGC